LPSTTLQQSFTANSLQLTPLSEADACSILEWRYDSPYDWYNPPPLSDEAVANLIDPQWQFHSIKASNKLIAYASFGKDGRVTGGDYSDPAIDIGLGVAPALTGRGLGAIVLQAILEFAETTFRKPAARLTVARFNQRAIRLYDRAGFQPTQEFTHERVAYWVMVKSLGDSAHQSLTARPA
jgi:ribosomal-protein-alanine N-acetyltransferase